MNADWYLSEEDSKPRWFLGEDDGIAELNLAQRPPALTFRGYDSGHYVVRSDPGDDRAGETMQGHAALFDVWTEIDSRAEGNFMERIAPGAFRKTIAESKDKVRVLFNHGRDPTISDKILGSIEDLHEDVKGVFYKVKLFSESSFVKDLIPGLRANVYGSSFRGRVLKSDFQVRPPRSEHNPKGLPEQTIREFKLIELGPVTWPAYSGTSVGLRSMTDLFAPSIPKDEANPPPVGEHVVLPEPEATPSWFLEITA